MVLAIPSMNARESTSSKEGTMKARTTTIACFVTAGFVAIVALAYSLSNLGHMESRAADLYAGAAGPM